VAVLGGVVSAVAIEMLPWVTKDQTSQALIVELWVSAAVSLTFLGALRYFPGHRNARLQYLHLPLLGILSAGGACVCWDSLRGRRAFSLRPSPPWLPTFAQLSCWARSCCTKSAARQPRPNCAKAKQFSLRKQGSLLWQATLPSGPTAPGRRSWQI
jgi:hypothetical protein